MRRGFTLIELMLSIGILTVLFAIITINFFSTQQQTYLAEVQGILAADIRSQQTKAMTGAIPMLGAEQAGYGIHFDSDHYTLFNGTTYSISAPTNSIQMLPDGVTSSNTLAGNDLIFLRPSGEVQGYTALQDSVTLLTMNGNETVVFTINLLGTIVSGI